MPVARQSPRAPAMLRPWVVVLDLYAVICGAFHSLCRQAAARMIAMIFPRHYPARVCGAQVGAWVRFRGEYLRHQLKQLTQAARCL